MRRTRKRYQGRQPRHRCKFMQSRFPGVCAETGREFPAGEMIAWDSQSKLTFAKGSELYDRAKREIMLNNDGRDVHNPATDSSFLESSIDHFLAEGGEPHRPERFKHDARPENVSNVFRFSGGGIAYQNKRGRCEDAPCCGCCS